LSGALLESECLCGASCIFHRSRRVARLVLRWNCSRAVQLNPAVSVALMAAGALPVLQGVLNICGQILGAILAAWLLRGMLPELFQGASSLGQNRIPAGSSIGRAFLGAHPRHL
jgi:glycerol uptake facilitator-like aquaporin